MKTVQIYFLVIAGLMFASYATKHDDYRQQQQQAEVHREYCLEHSNCKSN